MAPGWTLASGYFLSYTKQPLRWPLETILVMDSRACEGWVRDFCESQRKRQHEIIVFCHESFELTRLMTARTKPTKLTKTTKLTKLCPQVEYTICLANGLHKRSLRASKKGRQACRQGKGWRQLPDRDLRNASRANIKIFLGGCTLFESWGDQFAFVMSQPKAKLHTNPMDLTDRYGLLRPQPLIQFSGYL